MPDIYTLMHYARYKKSKITLWLMYFMPKRRPEWLETSIKLPTL